MCVCVRVRVYIFISHAPHTKLIATTENDPQKPPKFHVEPNAHPDTQRNQPPTQPHSPHSTLLIPHLQSHYTYAHTLTCAHSPTLHSPSPSLSLFRPLWNPISHALVIKCVNNTWKALLTVFFAVSDRFLWVSPRGGESGSKGCAGGLTMGQLG